MYGISEDMGHGNRDVPMYLVVEGPRVKADTVAEGGDAPVREEELACLADRVGQELDGRLRQADGREAEGVQRVDAAAEDTEEDANHPHAECQTGQDRVVRPQTHARGQKDLLDRVGSLWSSPGASVHR